MKSILFILALTMLVIVTACSENALVNEETSLQNEEAINNDLFAAKNGDDKVTLCHFPPGDPDNPQVITVGLAAAAAHIRNHEGDGIVGVDYDSNCVPLPEECDNLPYSVISEFEWPNKDGSPHGLAYDGAYLWGADRQQNQIVRMDLQGNILDSFPAPGLQVTGITYDGQNFWSTDDATLEIYKLDPDDDLKLISSFKAPGVDATGLAFDGKYLWNADFNWNVDTGLIHKLTRKGMLVESFVSPGPGPEGLTYDGTHLWHVDHGDNILYQLDTSVNTLACSQAPGINPIGLTWDGEYLWLADEGTRIVYKLLVD